MKQTVEEAAREHQAYFEPCCSFNDESINFSREVRESVEIGRYSQSYESFIEGAEWQSKQSPWIPLSEQFPPIDKEVLVLCRIDIGIPYVQQNSYMGNGKWKTESLCMKLAWMNIPLYDMIG